MLADFFGRTQKKGMFVVGLFELNSVVVSTPLKNISPNRNLPQIGVKIKKIIETTGHVDRTVLVP